MCTGRLVCDADLCRPRRDCQDLVDAGECAEHQLCAPSDDADATCVAAQCEEGYVWDAGAAQCRHRPRSQSHDRIGTLSYQAIGVRQCGQRDAGETTERSSGMRWMQTLRKLPTEAPIAKARRASGSVASERVSIVAVGVILGYRAPPAPSTRRRRGENDDGG